MSFPEEKEVWDQWVFVLDHRVFILDQWVFVLDHRVFVLDQWVFVLDRRVFVLDQWVFVLDHRVFVLDQWVFVLDHRVFVLDQWVLGLRSSFSTHPTEMTWFSFQFAEDHLCRMIWKAMVLGYTLFFYKNLFYKNVEAEIDPNFKNVLRTFLRLRVD